MEPLVKLLALETSLLVASVVGARAQPHPNHNINLNNNPRLPGHDCILHVFLIAKHFEP
jgi:hypothetical protein